MLIDININIEVILLIGSIRYWNCSKNELMTKIIKVIKYQTVYKGCDRFDPFSVWSIEVPSNDVYFPVDIHRFQFIVSFVYPCP